MTPNIAPKTADEFIAFYQAIPEEKWAIRTMGLDHNDDPSCAFGLLYKAFPPQTHTEDCVARFNLSMLFKEHGFSVIQVNDWVETGRLFNLKDEENTAKNRIIAVLKLIKKQEEKTNS